MKISRKITTMQICLLCVSLFSFGAAGGYLAGLLQQAEQARTRRINATRIIHDMDMEFHLNQTTKGN